MDVPTFLKNASECADIIRMVLIAVGVHLPKRV